MYLTEKLYGMHGVLYLGWKDTVGADSSPAYRNSESDTTAGGM